MRCHNSGKTEPVSLGVEAAGINFVGHGRMSSQPGMWEEVGVNATSFASL